MRTCFLHAGGHRTGTTALQLFLRENREVLLARGYWVPRESAGKAGAHHVLLPALAGETTALARDVVAQFRRQLADSEVGNIILSSESAEGRGFDLAQAFRTLQQMGLAVVLIYYVRNHPQLINSRYMNQTKGLAFNRSFAEHVEWTLRQADHPPGRLLRAAEASDVRAIFRPYNEAVARTGIVRDFLDSIGLTDFAPASPMTWTNRSLGPVAVHAARTVMRELAVQGVEVAALRLPNRRGLLAQIVASLQLNEPAYRGLTTELAARIAENFQPADDAFAERVWGRTWADMFPGDAGRSYTPNDLDVVAPDRSQQRLLEKLSKLLRARIEQARKPAPAV